MNFLYRTAANLIFVFHFFLVLLVLFGWLVPSLWYLYMATLVATLISDLVFGYCILSKWEFSLRRLVNPKLNYDFTWTTYYTHKFTNQKVSHRFFKQTAVVFLILSIAINLYFKFL